MSQNRENWPFVGNFVANFVDGHWNGWDFDKVFGETGGTGTSVVDGYYVLVEPLPKGAHIVQYSGRLLFTLAEDGFDAELIADMTYHINVD